MENTQITGYTEVTMRIMHLKQEKIRQEDELNDALKELVYNLSPVSMVKQSLHKLAHDREVQFDLTKIGLNLGANFLIDRILGKNSSLKGFLSALLVEKISASFINNNLSVIISGIRRLINRNSTNGSNQ
ncbi:MAG: hypothetical protein A2066_06605 [Bacteroidetes bacterium GWB2_41_8]|nr:MAG: hypothetical protein A2066_06605 [Bacteroidetes bacterium GWB2_41_8]